MTVAGRHGLKRRLAGFPSPARSAWGGVRGGGHSLIAAEKKGPPPDRALRARPPSPRSLCSRGRDKRASGPRSAFACRSLLIPQNAGGTTMRRTSSRLRRRLARGDLEHEMLAVLPAVFVDRGDLEAMGAGLEIGGKPRHPDVRRGIGLDPRLLGRLVAR